MQSSYGPLCKQCNTSHSGRFTSHSHSTLLLMFCLFTVLFLSYLALLNVAICCALARGEALFVYMSTAADDNKVTLNVDRGSAPACVEWKSAGLPVLCGYDRPCLEGYTEDLSCHFLIMLVVNMLSLQLSSWHGNCVSICLKYSSENTQTDLQWKEWCVISQNPLDLLWRPWKTTG